MDTLPPTSLPLAEFSNYAELCNFEYAWSTAEEGTSTSCVSSLFMASAIWASSTAEEGTSASTRQRQGLDIGHLEGMIMGKP